MAHSTYMADTAASKSSEELANVWETVLSAETQTDTKLEVAASFVIMVPPQSETDQQGRSVPVKMTGRLGGD